MTDFSGDNGLDRPTIHCLSRSGSNSSSKVDQVMGVSTTSSRLLAQPPVADASLLATKDDRFCSFHVSSTLVEYLLDEEDEKLGWDLPDDGTFES